MGILGMETRTHDVAHLLSIRVWWPGWGVVELGVWGVYFRGPAFSGLHLVVLPFLVSDEMT